jgi:hypothetical protein
MSPEVIACYDTVTMVLFSGVSRCVQWPSWYHALDRMVAPKSGAQVTHATCCACFCRRIDALKGGCCSVTEQRLLCLAMQLFSRCCVLCVDMYKHSMFDV